MEWCANALIGKEGKKEKKKMMMMKKYEKKKMNRKKKLLGYSASMSVGMRFFLKGNQQAILS